MAEAPQTQPKTDEPTTKPGEKSTDDEIMAIRKAAGSIAEVIEPVQRVRQERTDR